jgi:hypothetical protein
VSIVGLKKKKVGAYDFEDSDVEEEFVEPNNDNGNVEELVVENDKPAEQDCRKSRRVTIQPPELENDEDADRVVYPQLRDFTASKHMFSGTRCVST